MQSSELYLNFGRCISQREYPLISYAPWKETKLHSAGRKVDSLQVLVKHSDQHNEGGEIMVKGDNVMLGYYKNKKATQLAIDENGWLHTGDLGLVDEDGFIFIKGRSKSMILGPSGQNIYPEELEAALNNLDYVLESLVLGRNGKVVALVCPDQERVEKESISKQDLEEIMENHRVELNKKIPKYMNVGKIELYLEEFEKTPKKSIKRYLYS